MHLTKEVRSLMWLMAAYYFLQIMGGNPGLHAQALDKYLVDGLGLNATSISTFGFIVALPFMVKPLWGILTDFFPILGYRRKSYFVVCGVLAATVCFFIAGLPSAPSFGTLATLCALFTVSIAMADVVCDGTMVEQGNPLNAADKLQSAQWIAAGTAGIIVALSKGYIAEYVPLQQAILFSVGFPIATVLLTLFFLKEKRVTSTSAARKEAFVGLKQAFRSRTLWCCAIFIFLWNLSPNLGSVFYLYEKTVLKFSDVLIGYIDTAGEIGGIIGYASFILLWNKLDRIRLFKTLVILGTLSTLSFLFLNGAKSALVIIFISGIVSSVAQIAILSLAAKACPRNAEALVFASLMGIYNFGTKGGTILGGLVYDHVGYNTLIYIGAFTTLLMLLFLPLIREKEGCTT
jgi:predicted MFS family arabinose efflux permease